MEAQGKQSSDAFDLQDPKHLRSLSADEKKARGDAWSSCFLDDSLARKAVAKAESPHASTAFRSSAIRQDSAMAHKYKVLKASAQLKVALNR